MLEFLSQESFWAVQDIVDMDAYLLHLNYYGFLNHTHDICIQTRIEYSDFPTVKAVMFCTSQ